MSDAGSAGPEPQPPQPAERPAEDVPGRPPRRQGRLLKRSAVVLVVLGLLTAGSLVAHAQWQRHQKAVAHRRLLDRQSAYLAAVRDLDHDVAVAIAPPLHVLAALDAPRPGDLIAARDALADGESLRRLEADLGRFDGLTVPAGWERHRDALRKVLQGMHDDLAAMRSDRDVTDVGQLSNDLESTHGTALWFATEEWHQGVTALFRERRQSPPTAVVHAGHGDVAPSMTSWVFGVDRVCIRGNLRAGRLSPRLHASPPSPAALRSYAELVRHMAHGLRAVPLPQEQAAPLRRMLTKVKALDSTATAFDRLAVAVEQLDAERASELADQIRTTLAGTDPLAAVFRRYHVVACAGALQSGSDTGDAAPPVQT